MVDFDLRQLQYFLAVAETLNISGAARKLRMTQPALSRQVRAFEDSVGSPLLKRDKKSISLTRAGEAMVREGKAILRSIETSLKRYHREIDGAVLRVGYAPSLASGLIQNAISSFSSRFPRVRVSWFDLSTHEMWEGLKKEELDLIIEVENDDPVIRWDRISQKPFRMALPPDHPHARRRFLKPEHINGERLLLLSRHEYPGYWNQVTTYFTEQQIDARVVGEFDGISSLKMGIEADLGIAFVAGSPDGLTTLKIKPEPAPLCIAIGSLKRRQLAEWDQAFVEEMKKAGEK